MNDEVLISFVVSVINDWNVANESARAMSSGAVIAYCAGERTVDLGIIQSVRRGSIRDVVIDGDGSRRGRISGRERNVQGRGGSTFAGTRPGGSMHRRDRRNEPSLKGVRRRLEGAPFFRGALEGASRVSHAEEASVCRHGLSPCDPRDELVPGKEPTFPRGERILEHASIPSEREGLGNEYVCA